MVGVHAWVLRPPPQGLGLGTARVSWAIGLRQRRTCSPLDMMCKGKEKDAALGMERITSGVIGTSSRPCAMVTVSTACSSQLYCSRSCRVRISAIIGGNVDTYRDRSPTYSRPGNMYNPL